ncbi:hypothetical protein CBS101457_002594 [Exobasidium rhododendri]|nr:hypothetical protein CBS101457_002594 [Exobasidium rhododendri]
MTTEGIKELGGGIRGQLTTVVSLYQALTNVYFLLIEQRASTSTTSTRSVIAAQVSQINRLVRDGLHLLSSRHQEKMRQSTLFSSQAANGTLVTPDSSQVAQGIQILDEVLFDLVTRARRHARNQMRIQELIATVQSQDNDLKTKIKKLSVLRNQCNRLVELGEEETRVMKRAEEHPIAYDEIIRYAHKLSQTTTAPPGFKMQLEEEETAEEKEVGEAGQPHRPLYQGGEEAANQSKAGQVPSHLQDKLPFPSIHAMRRSAMETPLLSWEAYKRGFQSSEEEELQLQQTDTASESRQQRRTSTQVQRQKAPAEEEEDGFGLDLN